MKAGTLAITAVVLYWALPYLFFFFISLFYFTLFAIGAI